MVSLWAASVDGEVVPLRRNLVLLRREVRAKSKKVLATVLDGFTVHAPYPR